MRQIHCYIAAAAFLGSLVAPTAGIAASAENGKTAFIQHGCWECHGFEGQGSTATSGGRVIADTKLPLDAFTAFVHNTSGAMPPFGPKVVSNAELADIYAYLESRPQPKPAKDIALLGEVP